LLTFRARRFLGIVETWHCGQFGIVASEVCLFARKECLEASQLNPNPLSDLHDGKWPMASVHPVNPARWQVEQACSLFNGDVVAAQELMKGPLFKFVGGTGECLTVDNWRVTLRKSWGLGCAEIHAFLPLQLELPVMRNYQSSISPWPRWPLLNEEKFGGTSSILPDG
jgi:hypothetical protein